MCRELPCIGEYKCYIAIKPAQLRADLQRAVQLKALSRQYGNPAVLFQVQESTAARSYDLFDRHRFLGAVNKRESKWECLAPLLIAKVNGLRHETGVECCVWLFG
ncbi:MAG: hypothetical protein ABIG44_17300 [Planctomycetota bacterium]